MKKYNAHISTTDFGNGYCDVKTLPCGPISESELEAYIKELVKHGSVPESSCLYCFNFDFHTTTRKRIFLSNKKTSNKHDVLHEEYSDGLSIEIKLKNRHKCSPNNPFHDIHDVCFQNIRDGKCSDNFVREIIGKYLFKDKYIKSR